MLWNIYFDQTDDMSVHVSSWLRTLYHSASPQQPPLPRQDSETARKMEILCSQQQPAAASQHIKQIFGAKYCQHKCGELEYVEPGRLGGRHRFPDSPAVMFDMQHYNALQCSRGWSGTGPGTTARGWARPGLRTALASRAVNEISLGESTLTGEACPQS